MNTKNKDLGRFIAAILVLFALLAFSATASAAIIKVPSAGNETIQQAINNVTATNRTIEVNATAYNAQGIPETVVVNKSDIIIRSVNGRAVVSAGGASDHVFDISDQTNVTLEGFEIRDANGTSQSVAGIYMYNASECNISNNVVTNISATGIYNHNAYGIYLSSSDNNTFSSSTNVSHIDADPDAYGILLSSSDNNTFSSSTNVSHIDADGDAYGIYLEQWSDGNTFSSSTNVSHIDAGVGAYGILMHYSDNNSFYTSTVYNLSSAYNNAYGIRLLCSSDNNSFYTSTVYNLSAYDDAYGIYLRDSNNNSFHTSTVYNLSSAYDDAYGIYLLDSNNNNRFSSGSISDINAPDWWDFYSDENSHRNSAENITISSYPTTISFTYDNGIGIKSVETSPQDPAGKVNISKYVNATNVTANSWLFLNVSYNESDSGDVDENSLRMWQHNGTDWTEVPGTNGINTAENYVYANITSFSIFAPLGNQTVNCTCGDICVNETGWWRDGGTFNASNTPIQHAVDNATAGDTICVKNGTYNENVDVTKSHLTIRSQNGSLATTVSASLNPDEHVFNITNQTNVTLEGFTIRDAYGANKDVAGIYMYNASECNIPNNVVTNISAISTYTAYGVWLNASDNSVFKNISMPGGISSGGVACGLYLEGSNNNSITTDGFGNISGNETAMGIYLDDSDWNNITAPEIGDITGRYVEGIWLSGSDHNIIDPMMGNLTATGTNSYAYGIDLGSSHYNTISNVGFGNISADVADAYGIIMGTSDHNDITFSTDVGTISGGNYTSEGIDLHNCNWNNISAMTFGDITSTYGDAYGIWLTLSHNNTITTDEFGDISGNDTAYGIYLKYSDWNNVTAPTIGNITGRYVEGIWLSGSDHNSIDPMMGNLIATGTYGWAYGIDLGGSHYNTISNVGFGNISADVADAYGIIMGTSDHNDITFSTDVGTISGGNYTSEGIDLHNCNWNNISAMAFGDITSTYGDAYGIRLTTGSHNNTITTDGFGDILGNDTAMGVYLNSSNNNTFSSGSISDINASTWWDFYSDASSHGNSAENITISSYPTTISFTYDNGVGIKSVETPPPDPALKSNIGKYVNATNVTANSWLFLNVSYNESDLGGVDEATLKMYRYNGTSGDWELADGSGINGVNTTENYVYANITEFSVFAPLGNVTEAPPNITSFAPPSPVNDTVCIWRTFNVTVNQTVNVSWYLNESFLHTNASVTEANYTLHAEFVGDNNVSAVATNANGTDMQTWVWNVSSLDNDGDGVSNAVEDGAPNNGDGNGDGTPDRDQSNVTSLPTATNRGYMTLVLSNCTQLKNVTALPEAPVDPDYDYPYGLVSFEIMCENGTVNITYHDATALTGYTYRKYGPTTPGDLGTIRWYDFSTYATIAGNRVTLSFQDNRLGDDTGGDGKIVDPGGPGISGVVAQVPVLTPIGMIALVGLLSTIAAISITKRKRR